MSLAHSDSLISKSHTPEYNKDFKLPDALLAGSSNQRGSIITMNQRDFVPQEEEIEQLQGYSYINAKITGHKMQQNSDQITFEILIRLVDNPKVLWSISKSLRELKIIHASLVKSAKNHEELIPKFPFKKLSPSNTAKLIAELEKYINIIINERHCYENCSELAKFIDLKQPISEIISNSEQIKALLADYSFSCRITNVKVIVLQIHKFKYFRILLLSLSFLHYC
jgi:hypothetical protein